MIKNMSRRKQSNPKPLLKRDDDEFPEGDPQADDTGGGSGGGSETAQSNGTPSPNGSNAPSPFNSPASSPLLPRIHNNNSAESTDVIKITINADTEPINIFIKEEKPDEIHIPKLRLNTALASDPALQPDAKEIRSSSVEDKLSVEDENENHPNLDNDVEMKEVRRKVESRSNSVIAAPVSVVRSSPPADLAPRVQVFKCGPCGIRFSSLSTLEAHQTYYCSHRKDADENNAPSKVSTVTADGTSGTSEPPAKTAKIGKQYACTQCSYSADKKVSLNRHMRMHQTSPTPSSTTSNGGDENLPNASQLQQPQQIDRYCTDCDIRFSSTKTYRAHKQHYCSSRHREESRTNNTTPKPPSLKRGESRSPPEAAATPKSPLISNSQQNGPYVWLQTNPMIIIPLSFIRSASVIPGPLSSIAPSVTNPDTTCFLLSNGFFTPIAVALPPSVAPEQPTSRSQHQNNNSTQQSRGPTPNNTMAQHLMENNISNASNSDVLKSVNKRDLSARESTIPLDLSVRRFSPGSQSRERIFSFSSLTSNENGNNRLDIEAMMVQKENLSMGSESVTPEQIVCAPSLPGSPPLTPSPKRRSHSPRAGSISVSPNLMPSGTPVILRPIIPSDLAMRLSESTMNSMSPHILNNKNVEIALRLSSASSNSEISPQPTPPLISLIPNPTQPTSTPTAPPQIFVKQGVTKCKECNIVFCKYENYLAHKKHYCSARNHEDADGTKAASPVSPQARSPSGGGLVYQQLICAPCGIKFTSLDNLSAHQMYYCPKRTDLNVPQVKESRCSKCKTVHEHGHPCPTMAGGGAQGGNHKCPICDVACSTSSELRKHMESHGPVKAFRCSICRYKGNTLRGMRTHIRMHFDKKTSDFNEENFISCIREDDGAEIPPHASVIQPTPENMQPVVLPQPPPQNHYCDMCNYSSAFKGNVIRHIKLVHTSNNLSRDVVTVGEGGESLLVNGDIPHQIKIVAAVTKPGLNQKSHNNDITIKEEPMDESGPEDSNHTSSNHHNEPEVIIKTELNDTLDYSSPPASLISQLHPQLSPSALTAPLQIHPPPLPPPPHISIPVTASIIQNNRTSPDLQSLTSAGQKHCKTCDIKFNHLRSFIAHKQYYCKSRLTEQRTGDTGSSPTQPNVVARATEASAL